MSGLAMRSFCLISLSLSFAVSVPACASTVLRAEDYDQSCKTAIDCVEVLVGDVCTCGCQNAAIATSAQTIFHADDNAAREACHSSLECVACPETSPPSCVAGKCVAGK